MPWTLVIGGTSPLGEAICEALAEAGHSVLIHYFRQNQKAERIVEVCKKLGVDASAVYGDLSAKASVDLFLDEIKSYSLSALIYNTGPYLTGSCKTTSIDQWQQIYQLNFWAAVQIIQALSSTISAEKGRIITLGVAGIGKNRANCYNAPYVNAKEALWHATLCFAKEFAPQSVCVNMVAPGHLETSTDLSLFTGQLPMGRPGRLAEAAHLIAFLLTKEAGYITGQCIEVAGGAFL